MKRCKIDIALDALNKAKGLSYPMIGYSYYADVKGNGTLPVRRSVYTIGNPQGGVSYSVLNKGSTKKTLAAIQEAISNVPAR